MADVFDPEKRSWLMSRIGSRNTTPEMRVRRAAHAMGLRFRLHRRDLPGSPDVVFPSRRLAVFVHGCFWHRHQGCRLASAPKSNEEAWTRKFERNVARDAKALHDLDALGWRTETIWECETRKADVLRKAVADRIAAVEPVP